MQSIWCKDKQKAWNSQKISYFLYVFGWPLWVSNVFASSRMVGNAKDSQRAYVWIFFRKKYQSLIIYIKHNVIYLTFRWFYRMRLLRKWRKKYHESIINSWKCIIKILIRSRKMLLISGNKLQKHIKKCCFQAINTLFSRYNRNFY